LQAPVPKPPAGLDYGEDEDSSKYTLSVTPPEENSYGTWQVVVTPRIIQDHL